MGVAYRHAKDRYTLLIFREGLQQFKGWFKRPAHVMSRGRRAGTQSLLGVHIYPGLECNVPVTFTVPPNVHLYYTKQAGTAPQMLGGHALGCAKGVTYSSIPSHSTILDLLHMHTCCFG